MSVQGKGGNRHSGQGWATMDSGLSRGQSMARLRSSRFEFEFRYESGSGLGANQSGGYCKLIHVAIE